MYDSAIYNISGGEPCYRVYTQVPDSDFYQKAGKLFLFCIVYSQPRSPYLDLEPLCIGLLLVHRRDYTGNRVHNTNAKSNRNTTPPPLTSLSILIFFLGIPIINRTV